MAGRVTQERTLGAILGLGIGDALGMPVAGLSASEVAETYGTIDAFHGRTFADGADLAPGEFTDETEIALCIMETYTSANGVLDPELIRARMQFLARGESRRWMSAETLRSLDDDSTEWYRSAARNDPEVALRGVTIGLIHASPVIDVAAVYRDSDAVVSLTHASAAAVEQAALVAMAVARTLAATSAPETLLADIVTEIVDPELATGIEFAGEALGRTTGFETVVAGSRTGNSAIDVITSGIAAFVLTSRFEEAVGVAASQGGASDSRAALAGALAGAHSGAGAIPQNFIDGLEGRIYLTLAAPWFYRTVQLLSGRAITLEPNGR